MKTSAAAAIAASVLIATGTQANPVITVTPTLAPNAFGSPSYDAWIANSIEGQRQGLTSYGTPGTPAYYQAQNVVTSAQAIVTGFPSWLGVADPGTAYGSAFANELGNRMSFGLKIDGNGSQFSISQLAFSAVSSDPSDVLGFSYGAGAYGYSTQYIGLLKGDDGILFTADDILVTGGSADQLVDGLIGRGSGNSLDAYCTGCTTAEQQAAIDAAASYFTAPTTFTGAYSLGDFSGSGSFTILPSVPEPASWALLVSGFALTGMALRRSRRTKVQFA